jgi:hypothetical protein
MQGCKLSTDELKDKDRVSANTFLVPLRLLLPLFKWWTQKLGWPNSSPKGLERPYQVSPITDGLTSTDYKWYNLLEGFKPTPAWCGAMTITTRPFFSWCSKNRIRRTLNWVFGITPRSETSEALLLLILCLYNKRGVVQVGSIIPFLHGCTRLQEGVEVERPMPLQIAPFNTL